MRAIAFATVTILGVLILFQAGAASEEKETAALQAAEAWLALVDAGSYDDSWDAAAGYFRNAVGREQWRQAIKGARGPLGKVTSRRLRSKAFMTELPGAPDGQYVVIQFDAAFENKRTAVETVTPMMDDDGSWRVSGYYIR